MHGEKDGVTIRLQKHGQSGPAKLFWWKPQTKQKLARVLEATSHNLFDLKGANRGDIPITRYFEMDVAFLGLRVQIVGFLIAKDLGDLLESKKTKLSGIIGWNLIKLAYQEFTKKHPVEVYNSCQCPQNVEPLLFSQLCVLLYRY